MKEKLPFKMETCKHKGEEFICDTCGKFCCEKCFGKNNCKECGEES